MRAADASFGAGLLARASQHAARGGRFTRFTCRNPTLVPARGRVNEGGATMPTRCRAREVGTDIHARNIDVGTVRLRRARGLAALGTQTLEFPPNRRVEVHTTQRQHCSTRTC